MGHPPLRLSEKKEESWGDVRLSTTFRGLLLTVVGSRSPRSVGAHSVSPREKRLLVASQKASSRNNIDCGLITLYSVRRGDRVQDFSHGFHPPFFYA